MQTLAHSTAFLCGMWDLREGLFSSFRWGLTKELLQFLYISWWFRFFTEIHFWKWESDPSVWPFIQILPYGTFEKSIINSIAFLTSGGLYEEWKTCMENSNNFLIVWCKKLSITVDDSKCNRLWYILYIYIFLNSVLTMMEEPQPLAPAHSSLKSPAPAPSTPSKSVNFTISPVSSCYPSIHAKHPITSGHLIYPNSCFIFNLKNFN